MLVFSLTNSDYEGSFEKRGEFDIVTFGAVWVLAFLLFAVTFIIRRLLDGRRPLVSLGLDFRRAALPAILACLMGILVNAAAYLLIIAAGGARPTFSAAAFAVPGGIVFAVVLLIGASAMEELGFRGYPVKVMDERWNRWGAVLLTSALFAVCHGVNPSVNPVGVINVFLAGVILALVYLKSGSLWAAIGFHFGWNFAEGPLLGSAVSGYGNFPTLVTNATSGPDIISGGGFGVEGSILATAVEASVIILLVFNKFPLIRLEKRKKIEAYDNV